MQNNLGTLYVVATPIGNLQDMTFRAIEVLKQVDRIVAEDTRHSTPLLKHFSIQKPILSMHDFNESERQEKILDYLLQGESIALICDAGTPLINDPGFKLVNQAKKKEIKVIPIPGACAVIIALCAAGLSTNKFCFEGFLPAKKEARCQQLKNLIHETRTIIFYEAPHRLIASLEDMVEIFGGNRPATVARELTKIYETIMTSTLQELTEYYASHADEQRGEIVLLVEGVVEDQFSSAVLPETVLEILLEELSIKQATTLASKITGERKNKLYEMALLKKKGD